MIPNAHLFLVILASFFVRSRSTSPKPIGKDPRSFIPKLIFNDVDMINHNLRFAPEFASFLLLRL